MNYIQMLQCNSARFSSPKIVQGAPLRSFASVHVSAVSSIRRANITSSAVLHGKCSSVLLIAGFRNQRQRRYRAQHVISQPQPVGSQR